MNFREPQIGAIDGEAESRDERPEARAPVKMGLNPAPSAISARSPVEPSAYSTGPTLPRIVIVPRSGLIKPLSIFNSVVLIRACPRRLTLRAACGSLIRRFPNLLLLRTCLSALYLGAPSASVPERLPRRLGARPIPPDNPQQLMPSPPGVRHLGCTKAFLRNLFFGPSQGPQFPPLHLERNIPNRPSIIRIRRRLRPIIRLPHLRIRILLPSNPMPPPIHIMRQRPCPHLPQSIEFGDIFNANNCVTHFLTELTDFRISNENFEDLPLASTITR
jgi:hypothetical protein